MEDVSGRENGGKQQQCVGNGEGPRWTVVCGVSSGKEVEGTDHLGPRCIEP